MVQVNDKVFKQVTNDMRDLLNWIAVFETEYELPKEVVKELRAKIEKIAARLGVEAL
ncbi:hypothetical protein J4457_00500 [Candidatus Woesearchaeota archaeon]|nr:hypothetical protein [Candidatus Woesearchaeota archaeon]